MINEENKTEIIEQYLEGSLDEKQRLEVEERMQTDAAFRAEVALQRSIIKNVQELERDALRSEISELFAEEEDHFQEETQQEDKVVALSRRNVYYAIAASALLVITASIFIWMNLSTDPLAGSVAVHLPEGSRGDLPPEVPEQIPVLIIEDHPEYDFHYRFGDTLKLYGTFSLSALSIEYEPNQDRYALQIAQDTYPIIPSDSIQALQP